jgi:hypothetical protein
VQYATSIAVIAAPVRPALSVAPAATLASGSVIACTLATLRRGPLVEPDGKSGPVSLILVLVNIWALMADILLTWINWILSVNIGHHHPPALLEATNEFRTRTWQA